MSDNALTAYDLARLLEEARVERDRYRRALEEIAGQDFRGNRPREQTIAWKALND